jgi:hypothetical protein
VENPLSRDVLHIRITAILAVVVLVGVGVWQVVASMNEKDAVGTFVAANDNSSGAQDAAVAALDATSSGDSDPISAVSENAVGEVVGAYAGLQQSGQYSSTTAAQVAGSIGTQLQAPVSYSPISASQMQTTQDTSYKAMMQYRTALQTSLKPLLQNTQPEYVIFGMYVETKQQTYLDQLRASAANYVAAASSTAALTVPADAVSVQLGLVNSMNEFAATLDDMADHADDPIASSVLLENYNQAENDVLNAFQALVTYEQSKTQ